MKTLFLCFATAFVFAQASLASIITYDAALLGSLESPSTASLATGFATVIIDTVAQTMQVEVTFSGLEGTTTASHIHCCTATPDTGNAGVATITPSFVGFPLSVTSGSYNDTYDLTLASTYNPAFITAEGSLATAESALLAGIAAGETYLNIHTTVFPGGEIRGYLAVAAPEPSTMLLAGFGLLGLGLLRRRAAQSA